MSHSEASQEANEATTHLTEALTAAATSRDTFSDQLKANQAKLREKTSALRNLQMALEGFQRQVRMLPYILTFFYSLSFIFFLFLYLFPSLSRYILFPLSISPLSIYLYPSVLSMCLSRRHFLTLFRKRTRSGRWRSGALTGLPPSRRGVPPSPLSWQRPKLR